MKMRSIGFRRIVDDETGFFLPAWNILRSLIILNRYLDITKMLHLVMCLCNLNTRSNHQLYSNKYAAGFSINYKTLKLSMNPNKSLACISDLKITFSIVVLWPSMPCISCFLTLLAASSMYRSVYDNSGLKG